MITQELTTKLAFYNPWWSTGKVPAGWLPRFSRPVLSEILSAVSKTQRAILLKGPRQVGKTTLLYQIINHLIQTNVDPKKIVYGSFDDINLQADPEQIIEVLSVLNRKPAKEINGYVFIDEAQFLPNWEKTVKKYQDVKSGLKFFISGSAASLLTQKTESLTGRIMEKIILPFCFAEFVGFKNPAIDLSQKLIFGEEIRHLLAQYLEVGGFPRFLNEAVDLRFTLMRQDIVDRVIYRDLATRFEVKNPQLLQKLFNYLGQNTSGIVNLTSLSSFLGISRLTTERYIGYLESSYLVFRLPKFSRRLAESLRANSKVHLIDPGLGTLSGADKDKIFESAVISHLWTRSAENLYFWRDQTHEIDGFLKTEKVPLEVKNSQSQDAPAGLMYFMKKEKIKKGVVVYLGKQKKQNTPVGEIEFVPADRFLLS